MRLPEFSFAAFVADLVVALGACIVVLHVITHTR